MVREQRTGGRCAYDVDWIGLREVGEQWRRQHHVAEERGLNDEDGAHAARSVHLENREKRLLRNLDRAHLLHSLLSLFLLLEEFALSRDVAAVAFGENVFAQRFDARARDDLVADRRLNRDL